LLHIFKRVIPKLNLGTLKDFLFGAVGILNNACIYSD
jgi:hypothetical protein